MTKMQNALEHKTSGLNAFLSGLSHGNLRRLGGVVTLLAAAVMITTAPLAAQLRAEEESQVIVGVEEYSNTNLPEDYESLVREDRIWEYGNTGIHMDMPLIYRMKFDGIKEIKGRNYNILKIIYVRSMIIDMIDGNLEIVSDKIDENPANYPEFYMREENGIVYGIYEQSNCFFTWDDYLTGKKIPFDDNEFILHNFAANVDDVYESVTHSYDEVSHCKYKICHKGERENLGRVFRIYELSYAMFDSPGYDDADWGPIEIAEGIGPLTRSCLPYLKTRSFCINPNRYENDLKFVYDIDGNIIYKAEGIESYEELTSSVLNQFSLPEQKIDYHDNLIQISGTDNATLTLCDASGRQVLSRDVQGGDQVDISELPAGIYIATLSSGATLKICHK